MSKISLRDRIFVPCLLLGQPPQPTATTPYTSLTRTHPLMAGLFPTRPLQPTTRFPTSPSCLLSPPTTATPASHRSVSNHQTRPATLLSARVGCLGPCHHFSRDHDPSQPVSPPPLSPSISIYTSRLFGDPRARGVPMEDD